MMKKRIIAFIFTVILLLSCSATASAKENDDLMDKIIKTSGVDRLYDVAPDNAKQFLKDNGIDAVDYDGISGLSIKDFFVSIADCIKEKIKFPFTMFLSCIGIILLAALLNSLKDTFKSGATEQMFAVISTVSVACVVARPISEMIISIADITKQASDFLLSFVPVYVGVVATSGKPILASAYSGSVIMCAQVISRISSTVLVPLLSVYMAFCLIGGVSDKVDISSIAKGVKNIVVVSLSFLLTVFSGLLTVKGVVANSADTVTIKTAKFMSSTFLPVVGGAVSDALNSVYGCVGLIKTAAGGFGIIAIAGTFLPIIISLAMFQLSLSVAEIVSDALNTNQISMLLNTAKNVLAIMLSIIIVFALLMVISLGIMLSVSGQ